MANLIGTACPVCAALIPGWNKDFVKQHADWHRRSEVLSEADHAALREFAGEDEGGTGG